MTAAELYRVGRWLTKAAEEAMRVGDGSDVAPGVRAIMAAVDAEPDSSVGEIAARTALPQGYVSEVIGRYRDLGFLFARPDPKDRRRVLVRLSEVRPPGMSDLGAQVIDDLLMEAVSAGDPLSGRRLVEQLEMLASELTASL